MEKKKFYLLNFFSNCSVEHKSLSKYNRCNVVQARAIVAEQPSNFGQIGLERSLEKSKENGAQIHCCPVTDDPDLQKQSLSSAQISNKLSTASQTDLFGEVRTVYEIKIIVKS